jgi:lipopolysaccharide/colanic/teichoic acid biosynthesis glycosyltransferase
MDTPEPALSIPRHLLFMKRLIDVTVALAGLLLAGWVIAMAALVARLETGEPGFFAQSRIGRHGRPFDMYKIRTMKSSGALQSTVTTLRDERITRSGKIFRRTKIDELPQLYNVLVGQMSLVGPRPDVAGFADRLVGEDRAILALRPGITGPATLMYRDEETLLAGVDDPETYNREVVFPHKVRINLDYIRNYSLIGDIKYMIGTVFG